jgi:replicative superfamily II helicase
LYEVRGVVVYGLHTVAEAGAGRGATVETLLTSLLHATSDEGPSRRRHPGVQLVATSATMGGAAGTLARWLRARLLTTDCRPVPVAQYALTRTAR